MVHRHFAVLSRALGGDPSRRDVLRGLAVIGIGLGAARLPVSVEAANSFGCRKMGDRCKRASQCCSNICQRKHGKKQCIAHNTGGCTSQFNGCGGLVVGCGTAGFCFRTTGNAAFCGGPGGDCVDCKNDADCQEGYGAGAACVVCDDCKDNGSNGTACYPAAV